MELSKMEKKIAKSKQLDQYLRIIIFECFTDHHENIEPVHQININVHILRRFFCNEPHYLFCNGRKR